MAKRNSKKSKPSVKIRDLKAKENPKGGKLVDKASAKLMKACATGEHFTKGSLL